MRGSAWPARRWTSSSGTPCSSRSGNGRHPERVRRQASVTTLTMASENSEKRQCWGRTRSLHRCGRIGNWPRLRNCGLFCDDHRFQPFTLFFLVVPFIADITGITSFYSAWSKPDPNRLEDVLLPANDPDPTGNPTDCRGPTDSVKVQLGSTLAFASIFPYYPIALGNSHVLAIDRTGDGLSIDAIVTDSDAKVIANIRKNRFSVNPNNIFRREIPDNSTLIVWDQYNYPALHVRYLNRHAVRITGRFTEPLSEAGRLDSGHFFVTNDAIIVSGWGLTRVQLGPNCLVGGIGTYCLWCDPNERGYIWRSIRPRHLMPHSSATTNK